jgi:hypothetical protein
MRNVIRATVLAGLIAALAGGPALAAPLSGSYTANGAFVPVNLGGAQTSLGSAEAIDFVPAPAGAVLPTPGEPGAFVVSQASGDFSHLVGLSGTIQDVSLLGTGNPSYPVPPIPMFQQVGDVTFDLTSLSIISQDDEVLFVHGEGTFLRAGFDDTSGTMRLAAESAGDYGFATMTLATHNVPEPTSMVLMGLGLLGVAATIRRPLFRR